MALTVDGQVFSLGNNAHGQCGRNIIENEDYLKSRIIHKIEIGDMEKDDKIIDITCGMDHR